MKDNQTYKEARQLQGEAEKITDNIKRLIMIIDPRTINYKTTLLTMLKK